MRLTSHELIAALRRPERGPAVRAAAELGRMGGPEACAALADALRAHPEAVVRAASAGALGQIGGEQAAQALVGVLGEPDRMVWHAAAEALAGLDDEAMPAVIALLQSRDQGARRAALSGLLWLTVEHDDPEVSLLDDVVSGPWGWWN